MPRGRTKGEKSNKLVFENESYKIAEIPLNYQIECKLMKTGNKKHEKVKLIPEMFYSDLGRGLEYAKETAEYMLNKYKQ